MENINLIHHVVPSGGWYCAIGIPPAKNKGPITKFTKDTDELKTFFEGFIASGYHTYFALAKYNNDAPKPLPEGGRKIIHAEALQSLWLDIDCGPGKDTEVEQSTGLPKGYASKKEGYKAAKKFWELLDLPPPTVVDSCNYLQFCSATDKKLSRYGQYWGKLGNWKHRNHVELSQPHSYSQPYSYPPEPLAQRW